MFVLSNGVCREAPDWREEQNIYEKIYDARLQLADGESATLHQLASKSPLIVTMIFTRCSGVCYPLLLRLKEQLRAVDSSQYDVLVVSFDPRDSEQDMLALAKRFGLENSSDWKFATTDSIGALTKSVGFSPVWSDSAQQFDHDAFLVGVNERGFITKKLIGMRDDKAINSLIGSVNSVYSVTYRLPTESSLFSCFNYDPVTGKSTPGLGLLFIAIPPVLAFSIVILIRMSVHRRA
jgi:cytochrome oxidase Cu insertion factor (SCO1/SenC/PrrC family)